MSKVVTNGDIRNEFTPSVMRQKIIVVIRIGSEKYTANKVALKGID